MCAPTHFRMHVRILSRTCVHGGPQREHEKLVRAHETVLAAVASKESDIAQLATEVQPTCFYVRDNGKICFFKHVMHIARS